MDSGIVLNKYRITAKKQKRKNGKVLPFICNLTMGGGRGSNPRLSVPQTDALTN